MTYRELVYMVLDELKLSSDDTFFTEDHVIFLAKQARAFLLDTKYSKVKNILEYGNQQLLCLELEEVPAVIGIPCEGGHYLRSIEKIPKYLHFFTPTIMTIDMFNVMITFVSKHRMPYVGNNKYLQNMIYACIGPDNHLYLRSANPQFLYLSMVKFNAVFEDPEEAATLECDKESECDTLDKEFPIEAALVPQLIELILNNLRPAIIIPEDKINDTNEAVNATAQVPGAQAQAVKAAQG